MLTCRCAFASRGLGASCNIAWDFMATAFKLHLKAFKEMTKQGQEGQEDLPHLTRVPIRRDQSVEGECEELLARELGPLLLLTRLAAPGKGSKECGMQKSNSTQRSKQKAPYFAVLPMFSLFFCSSLPPTPLPSLPSFNLFGLLLLVLIRSGATFHSFLSASWQRSVYRWTKYSSDNSIIRSLYSTRTL